MSERMRCWRGIAALWIVSTALLLAGCLPWEDFGVTSPDFRNGLDESVMVAVEYENGESIRHLVEPGIEVGFGRKAVPIRSQVFTVDGKEILHLTGQDLANLLAKETPIRAEKRTRIIIWNLDQQGLHPMTYDEVQRLKKK